MKRFTCILVLLATVTVASAQTDAKTNGSLDVGGLFLGITGGMTNGIKIPHNLPDGGIDPANPIVSGDDKYRGFETGVTAGYGWDITGRWRVSLAGTVMYGMLYHLQTLTFSSKETQSRTFQIPYMEIGMLPRLTYSLTDYLSVGAGIGGCLRTSSLNEPNVFGCDKRECRDKISNEAALVCGRTGIVRCLLPDRITGIQGIFVAERTGNSYRRL